MNPTKYPSNTPSTVNCKVSATPFPHTKNYIKYDVQCQMVLYVYGKFLDDTPYKISEQMLLWMMNEFIHWPKPDLLTS